MGAGGRDGGLAATGSLAAKAVSVLVVTEINALVWDGTRVLANALFLGFFGVKVIRVLKRFKKRFYWNTG